MKSFIYLLATTALLLGAALTSCKKDITYYTVTFDGNGGQIHGETVITVAKGDYVHYLGELTPPENHTLNGWYKEAEAINEWDFNDAITGDMTLYAGWERVYTFTFHGNGGKSYYHEGRETWTDDYYRYGYQLHFPDNVIKPGYVLEGWYKDRELTEPWDFETDTVKEFGHYRRVAHHLL